MGGKPAIMLQGSRLRKEYAIRTKEIDKDLDSIYTLLSQYKDYSSYIQLNKDLIDHLENFIRQILIKEEKKLQRDKMAFQEGRAFYWSPIHPKKAFQSRHYTR